MKRVFFGLGGVLLGMTLAGCATTDVRTAEAAQMGWSSDARQIVLMEPDIVLSELLASGIEEPRADWTTSAKQHVDSQLREILQERNISIVSASQTADEREFQLTRLHGAVGQAILLHLYTPGLELPNKGDALDWTIGPGANALRERYDADYGLFLFVRDSYTTAGRAVMMVGAALFGVALQGGQTVGFASLVDLRTGNIVWFNLMANAAGDLREEDPARDVVEDLVTDIPL